MHELLVAIQKTGTHALAFLGVFSALTASLAVLVARRQSHISAETFRLNLYNRRFDIYSKVVDFYQAVIGDWKASESEQVHRGFIKAYKESRFLFDPKKSRVHEILGEMHTKSWKIIGLKEHGKDLVGCHEQFLQMQAEADAALAWLPKALEDLEREMAPALNFQKISA
jgi:hypothetical protein